MSKDYVYIITQNGSRLDFILDVSSKHKRLSLAVNEGRLTVRAPIGCPKATITSFIESHMDWIDDSLSITAKRSGLPQTYEDGEEIRILGEWKILTLKKSERYSPARIENDEIIVNVCGSSDKKYIADEVGRLILLIAEREIKESMSRLTKLMGLYPKKVTIKSLNASWGRCSSEGNISINYKVITYPKHFVDYVCIHELSHLVHMNHSPQFWSLVEKYCPDWKSVKNAMK